MSFKRNAFRQAGAVLTAIIIVMSFMLTACSKKAIAPASSGTTSTPLRTAAATLLKNSPATTQTAAPLSTDAASATEEPAVATEPELPPAADVRSSPFKDGWFYFAYPADNSYLYKARPDGSEKQLVAAMTSSSVTTYGDWVYFFQFNGPSAGGNALLYRTRLDGSETAVVKSPFTNIGINIINDYIYYGGVDGIHRMNLDGSEDTIVNPIMGAMGLHVSGGYFYFNRMSASNLRKVKISGGEPVVVIERSAQMIRTAGDKIYFQQPSGAAGDPDIGCVFSVTKYGSNLTKMTADSVTFYEISGEWLYYSIRGSGNARRVKLDGTSDMLVSGESVRIEVVSDQWLYVRRNDDLGTLYKVRTDGTEMSVF